VIYVTEKQNFQDAKYLRMKLVIRILNEQERYPVVN
jgi:hypothetical protein